MDEIDKKIVNRLQLDGRVNYNVIAKQLKLANATIHARIIKLGKKGVIRNFTVNLNPEALGKPLAFMLSIAVDHSRDLPEQTIKSLLDMQDVIKVCCVTGEWDYHIFFQTKDISKMKWIVTDEIKKKVPTVLRSSTQILLDVDEKPIALE